MINAKELRVGVSVLDGHDVEIVTARMIQMVEDGSAEFDPIPLTPEVLVACGFVKEKLSCFCNWISEDNYVIIYYLSNSVKVVIYCNGIKAEIVYKELNHLHQLQNAVALTGQELEYKQKS